MEYACLECSECFCQDCNVLDEKHRGDGHTRVGAKTVVEEHKAEMAKLGEEVRA
eukprot:CAMPEP_0185583982 /NCGR_PEP_ID=MMETSP0434-20130131/29478_1 /TAXON_ID=626734 ORGANISM="Favella taraikaensis, Strain Fe Narragansett Bay" /NCGR_SAMPLE_ID=MMETSP0434 /ASSEMBLY_ACC=CAM_ASM_000379 /LENGTH=53 /DNA_ID=CAMNT_0028203459 /DNA_START=263 /DNA_END=424 /DNA_ORIENTATION=-